MPELPDIVAYLEALRPRIVGRRLDRVLIRSPFLVRTAPPDPAPEACAGRSVRSVSRLGKRIAIGLEGDLYMVFHLMIAGRFRWKDGIHRPASRIDLAAFQFAADGGREPGTLVLTEAGTRRRASLHIRSAAGVAATEAVEPLDCTAAEFGAALRRENHTLKRALTDPRLISGIGNAYSDEILHAARLSPTKLTASLSDAEIAGLLEATRGTLRRWIDELRRQFGLDGGGPGDSPGRARSRRSVPGSRCTAASAGRARCAARRCSASCAPRTKPTIVRDARPAGGCWPTDRCRGF